MYIRESLRFCRDPKRQSHDQVVDDKRAFWETLARDFPGDSLFRVWCASDVFLVDVNNSYNGQTSTNVDKMNIFGGQCGMHNACWTVDNVIEADLLLFLSNTNNINVAIK